MIVYVKMVHDMVKVWFNESYMRNAKDVYTAL